MDILNNSGQEGLEASFVEISEKILNQVDDHLQKTAADTEEKDKEFLAGMQSLVRGAFGIGSNPCSPVPNSAFNPRLQGMDEMMGR